MLNTREIDSPECANGTDSQSTRDYTFCIVLTRLGFSGKVSFLGVGGGFR